MNSRRKYPAPGRGRTGGRGRIILVKLGVVGLILGLAGGLAVLGYGLLTQSGLFQIVDIKIEGCRRISKKEILELSGVDVHSNIIAMNSGQVRDLLEGHDWVKRAHISRNLSNGLTISIEERLPVAIVNLAEGLRYVDQSAAIFAPVGKGEELDFPVITGLTAADLAEPSGNSSLAEALLLIKYAGRDNPNLPVQNISEINVRDRRLTLFLMDRPFPIRLGRGEIWQKYNRLVLVLYWLYKRNEFDRVAYLDVEYSENKVLVGMEPG